MKRLITHMISLTLADPLLVDFRYYYLFSIDSLKNDLFSVLSIEQSFSRPVKLGIFVYQDILACFSDETQVRDECVMSIINIH